METQAFVPEVAIGQFSQTITQLRELNRRAAEQGLVFSADEKDGGQVWTLQPMTLEDLLSYHSEATPAMVQAAAAGWPTSEIVKCHEYMAKAATKSQSEADTYHRLARTCATLLRGKL